MERERERDTGDKSGDGREADAYDAAGLDTLVTTLTPAQRHKHTAYLLFLEGADAEAGMSWGAWTLDALVQACQPEPTMTHAELFVPPENADQEVHFSTYLGKQANWGSAFAGGQSFYLGTNKDLWVAVPVMCMDAAPAPRARGARWHGLRHVPPVSVQLRICGAAAAVRRRVGGRPNQRGAGALRLAHGAVPARRHRGGGTAKPVAVVRSELALLEMTSKERFERYAAQRSELRHTRSLPEEEAVIDAANVLVWGADTSVVELDDDTCAEAIEHLCDRAVEAGCYGDVRKQRETQHHLALALVRWSQLKRETVRALKRAQEKAALERAALQAAADPDALSNADTEHAAGGGGDVAHASGGENSGSEGAAPVDAPELRGRPAATAQPQRACVDEVASVCLCAPFFYLATPPTPRSQRRDRDRCADDRRAWKTPRSCRRAPSSSETSR